MSEHHGAHQTAEAYAVSLCEDFCKSPTAPVGYMVYQMLEVSQLVCNTVHGCGTPVLNMSSRLSSVIGNEAGIGGGLVSGVNVGVCRPIASHARRVRAEGQFVLRDGTLMEMNMCGIDGTGNTIGKIIYCSASAAPDDGGFPSDHPLDVDANDLLHIAGFAINLPLALLLKGVSLIFPDFGMWLKDVLPETSFGTKDNTGIAGGIVGNNMKSEAGPPGILGIAMGLVHYEGFWGDGVEFEKGQASHDFWTGRGEASDALNSIGDTLGQGFGILARRLGVGDEFYEIVKSVLGERDGYGFVQGVFNGSRPPL